MLLLRRRWQGPRSQVPARGTPSHRMQKYYMVRELDTGTLGNPMGVEPGQAGLAADHENERLGHTRPALSDRMQPGEVSAVGSFRTRPVQSGRGQGRTVSG